MAKRRLKISHKVELFDLAMTKFIDKTLRAAEDKASRKFAQSLVADWKASLAGMTPYLEACGLDFKIKSVGVPEVVPVKASGKSFVRPDGVEVKREDRDASMLAPLSRIMTANEANMRSFVNIGEDRPYHKEAWRHYHGRGLVSSVDLPEQITYPIFNLNLNYKIEDKTKAYEFRVNERPVTWVSAKTLGLLKELYEAGHARANAENLLWRAIGKVIWTSTTFEDLLEYWPEARLIEDKLYPQPTNLGSLVPISADEKAAICANMHSRGIEAPACAI